MEGNNLVLYVLTAATALFLILSIYLVIAAYSFKENKKYWSDWKNEFVLIKPSANRETYYVGQFKTTAGFFFRLSEVYIFQGVCANNPREVSYQPELLVNQEVDVIEIIALDEFIYFREKFGERLAGKNDAENLSQSQHELRTLLDEAAPALLQQARENTPGDFAYPADVPLAWEQLRGCKVAIYDTYAPTIYGVFRQFVPSTIILSDVIIHNNKPRYEVNDYTWHAWLWIGSDIRLRIVPISDEYYDFVFRSAFPVIDEEAELPETLDDFAVIAALTL